MTIPDYCAAVCRFVRFSPDHDAITAELTAHLEDHRDALLELRSGLTQEEAEEAAVEAMGDPEELGRALNESHSPLLGWFQIWFQAVVWFLSAIIVIFCEGSLTCRIKFIHTDMFVDLRDIVIRIRHRDDCSGFYKDW